MDAAVAPPRAPDARLAQTLRADATVVANDNATVENGSAAPEAAKLGGEDKEQLRTGLITGTLVVELDPEAGRFVNTVTDDETHEVIWRFPNETQLAYARAINAYIRAKSERG